MNLPRLLLKLLLGARLPLTQGSLTVPGLHGGVRIHRDRWGIALIEADDGRDGPFALGFCHGQDRAFQLEMMLRVGRGTLAELVGSKALPVDRLSRRIGFARSAAEQLALLDPDIRDRLEAYSRGVHAGVTLGCPRVPHEFVLLRATPTPWTPHDTLTVTKLLSFTLMSNWDAELVRYKVLTSDGAEALRALDATYPAWQPVTMPVGAKSGDAADRLAHDLAAFLAWKKPGGGSNNWVIAGSRTTTGRPILANDPHLDAALPAHWYLASLRTPAEHVAGASFVGGPAFLIGHNGRAAWGLTAGLVDNTDLFLEKIGSDGVSVLEGDRYSPCRVVDEVIAVKGAAPVTERVLVTRRGPIVGPVLGGATEAFSLRATWLDPLPITGFFRLHHVKTFAEFRQAFAHWPASAQNLVYADTSGTIGWQLIGRVPVRKKGYGTIPLAGADPEVGWHDEAVPFEDVPYLQNPECGYIATANTRPVPEGQGPFLGVDFIDGYRLLAITRALGHRQDWDVPETMKLQMDQLALAWQELREVVLAAPSVARHRDVAGLPGIPLLMLNHWDGRVTADSQAAAVYELFLAEMFVRVAKAKAPQSWRWILGEPPSAVTPYNFGCFRRTGHLVKLLREQPVGWFAHSWVEEIDRALNAAVQRLNSWGGITGNWPTWGELRTLVMHHPLARKPGLVGKLLGKVFNLGPVPCGGDADVINQASVLPLDPLAPADNIPSVRAVFDVGAWHESRFAVPGGQSGNPLSAHYGDLFSLWQRGEGVAIAFTAEEVQRATVQTLELR